LFPGRQYLSFLLSDFSGVGADASQVQKSGLTVPELVVYSKLAVLVHACAAATAGIKARTERVRRFIIV
jgi:hypothetical protein